MDATWALIIYQLVGGYFGYVIQVQPTRSYKECSSLRTAFNEARANEAINVREGVIYFTNIENGTGAKCVRLRDASTLPGGTKEPGPGKEG